MQFTDNRVVLLERMDKARDLFFQEVEKLSVLLAAKRDPSSWTSYHDLLRQRKMLPTSDTKKSNVNCFS